MGIRGRNKGEMMSFAGMEPKEFAEKYKGRKIRVYYPDVDFGYIGEVIGYCDYYGGVIAIDIGNVETPFPIVTPKGTSAYINNPDFVFFREADRVLYSLMKSILEIIDEKPQVDKGRFPHICPKCSAAAYIGSYALECSNNCNPTLRSKK